MIAKRFKLVEYLPNVIQIEDNHQKLHFHEIVDLLNELHEENKELKKENEELQQKNKEWIKYMHQLEIALKKGGY